MIEKPEPLNRRLGRFAAFLGSLFALSAGISITQRLSDDALALVLGLTCGIAAMLPTIGLVLLAWRHEENRREETRARMSARMSPAGAPPVVIVTPQALSGYGQQQMAAPENWGWNPHTGERQFTIVGGEE